MSKNIHIINLFKFVVLATALQLTLSGCGFQLRGSGLETTAGQTIFLIGTNPYGVLERKIKSKLRAASTNIEYQYNENNKSSGSVDNNSIEILRQQTRRETISVDANGRPAEYETIITIIAKFSYKEDQQEIKTFTVGRDYRYNSENNLAYDRETETIISEMYEDLSNRLVSLYLKQLSKRITDISAPTKTIDRR